MTKKKKKLKGIIRGYDVNLLNDNGGVVIGLFQTNLFGKDEAIEVAREEAMYIEPGHHIELCKFTVYQYEDPPWDYDKNTEHIISFYPKREEQFNEAAEWLKSQSFKTKLAIVAYEELMATQRFGKWPEGWFDELRKELKVDVYKSGLTNIPEEIREFLK